MKIKIPLEKKTKFREKIEELSGENLFACYQCGRCSGGCPGASQMDMLPNQVMRYIYLGAEEEVLNSKTIWVCASCYMCTQRCPKGVNLTKVMEAARQMYLRKNQDYFSPDNIPQKDREELPTIAMVSCLRKMSS
ncbi:4Fe-4S dicluster domain-containing protein [bacterium]|nr:4Fe-4S dicluster domain-containing protein [bacterium]